MDIFVGKYSTFFQKYLNFFISYNNFYFLPLSHNNILILFLFYKYFIGVSSNRATFQIYTYINAMLRFHNSHRFQSSYLFLIAYVCM